MIADFLNAMAQFVPDDARLMYCQFRGDPDEVDDAKKWQSRPLRATNQLDPLANVYLTVSAMKRNERGEFRRRKENYSGGLLLMIDDLGTGKGAKFSLDILSKLPPTAIIETSPGNHQAIYMFDRLVTDMGLFERLIKGFIDKQFLGKDTGMAGVNRVFRPPFGVNGKARYGGWVVKCVEWNPGNRYSVERIAEAYSIDLNRPSGTIPRGATIDKAEAIRSFVNTRAFLRAAGMLKGDGVDLAGWQDISCPWVGEHTGGVDNGAAIREPAEENGFVGGFRCHHGACRGKNWRHLTDWILDNQAFMLGEVNARAKEFHDYGRE